MMKVIQGDIFKSKADAILHQVNCKGSMGSGIAKQVRELYPNVYNCYKAKCNEYKEDSSLLLGSIQICYKENYIVNDIKDSQMIVNMFAQDKYGYGDKRYTNYNALKRCLQAVNKQLTGKSVAIPYLMSCCRGGGDWNIVSNMIHDELSDCSIEIYRLG